MKIPAILTSAMLVLTALSAGAQSMAIEHKKTTFTLAEAQAYAIENNLNVENSRLDLESARQAFSQLIDQYPKHRKVPDATFKLAKVYHLQGNSEKARKLLDTVIKSYGDTSSSAVKLARDYLQKNF